MTEAFCLHCGNACRLTDGGEIYANDKFEHLSFWKCDNCEDAYVGCHPGTDKPLGSAADKTVRAARSEVHRLFDPMWRGESMTRSQAYRWLARQLNIPFADCHIGMFDEGQCSAAIKRVELRNQKILRQIFH